MGRQRRQLRGSAGRQRSDLRGDQHRHRCIGDASRQGFTQTTTTYADGSSSTLDTGHNLVILFPSDDPAGPSTTLYIGVVELTNTADGVTTLGQTVGRSRDICAELS